MKRLALAFLVALLAVGGAGWWLARASLPPLDGLTTLSGLHTPVEVIFDDFGAPSVYALTTDDAWFAAGVLHARERLWQMELYRRVTTGRLSEILGEKTIAIDQRFLTIGLRDAAETEWRRANPVARAALERYAEGVNAVIQSMPLLRRPIEFQLLRLAPAPWTPQDSLAIGRLLAWRLAENHQAELIRGVLSARFGAQAAEELGGRYPADAPAILPGAPRVQDPAVAISPEAPPAGVQASAGVAPDAWPAGLEWLAPGARRGGSNSWVVAGRRTKSGRPLLANDPHLPIEFPAVWYEMHLVADRLDVSGVTIPGVPFVAIGHNARVAWGMTNTGADVQDLYLERIDVGRKTAFWQGAWEPVQVMPSDIPVRGRGTPVPFEVWKTRHGPIFADTRLSWDAPPAWLSPDSRTPGEKRAYALRWLSDGDVASAFEAIDRATNWETFIAAVEGFSGLSQNVVYADVEGNIGYAMSGRLPLRASGNGAEPRDGASGAAEWVPSASMPTLPRVFNPPSGYITTSNNEIDRSFAGLITRDWVAPYRAMRLHEVLSSTPLVDIDAMVALQNDRRSVAAGRVLERLKDVIAESRRRNLDAGARGLLEQLDGWNRVVDGRPIVTAYEVFEDAVWRRTFHDEMDDALYDQFYEWAGAERPAGLYALLGDRQSAWFDDIATVDRRETRDDIYLLAAADAVETLQRQWGSEAGRPWDVVHAARFEHPLGAVAYPLARLFNRGPVPVDGDGTTVLRISWNRLRPYAAWEIPSWRQVLDAGQWDLSRVILPAGQSGHPLSPHYFDQNDLWRQGRHRLHRYTRSAVTAGAAHRLLLVP